jgi:hypothetical protein
VCPRTGPAGSREDFGDEVLRLDAGASVPALAPAVEGVAVASRAACFALRTVAVAASDLAFGLADVFVIVRPASACEPRFLVPRIVRSPVAIRIARSL